MKKFSSVIVGLTLAASIAGCGTTTTPPPSGNGAGDMAKATDAGVGDTVKDMAMVPMGTGATGDPCTNAKTDCANGNGPSQTAKCLKSVQTTGGGTLTYGGGYCTTPCRPSKNDMNNNYLNSDCPGGNATCAGSGASGQCVATCQSYTDCGGTAADPARAKLYVCAFTNGTPNGDCEPIGASTCDPPKDPNAQMISCAMGQRCVSYSPDASYGQCGVICDPVLQNCDPTTMDSCQVDFQQADGTGECINHNAVAEGGACNFLNDCDLGMICYNRICRTYCRTGGEPTDGGGTAGICPMGQTCKDMVLQGVSIKFHAAQTGICTP